MFYNMVLMKVNVEMHLTYKFVTCITKLIQLNKGRQFLFN